MSYPTRHIRRSEAEGASCGPRLMFAPRPRSSRISPIGARALAGVRRWCDTDGGELPSWGHFRSRGVAAVLAASRMFIGLSTKASLARSIQPTKGVAWRD